MARRTLPLVLAAVLLSGGTVVLSPSAVGALPPRPEDEYRPVRGPSAPAEFRYLQKTVPGEALPRHAYDTAAKAAARLPTVGGRWASVGPTNIGGRITSLALDPHRPDTVYAAAASGGVWVSRDAGNRFEPAWPENWTQAMGAVATGPDGTLYAGTGEANPGGGSITCEGTGLYASRDGGRSWRSLGLRDSAPSAR